MMSGKWLRNALIEVGKTIPYSAVSPLIWLARPVLHSTKRERTLRKAFRSCCSIDLTGTK